MARKGLTAIAMLIIFVVFIGLLIGYLALRAKVIPDESSSPQPSTSFNEELMD